MNGDLAELSKMLLPELGETNGRVLRTRVPSTMALRRR
jgi:hypothetical protein